MRRILVFDVNETLLDIEVLGPFFARVLGDAGAMRRWFAQLILYSEVVTLADCYADFGALGGAVLRMIGDAVHRDVSDADVAELGSLLRSLPAHADAVPALTRLRDAGFRLTALSNSAPAVQATQLGNAGLSGFFERVFSVDAVSKFKPAPETYRYVAAELGTRTDDLMLIACHAWDTIGAQSAGCAAAFVARPGNRLPPIPGVALPEIQGNDLLEVTEAIIAAG